MTIHDEIWASVPADRPLDERAVAWALEAVALAGQTPRVLDLGCGDGRISARLAAAGADVTGADPSPVALARARAAHPGPTFVEMRGDGRAQNVITALTSFERHHDPLEPALRFYTRGSLASLLDAFRYGEVVVAAA